jgi:hypothetical protein
VSFNGFGGCSFDLRLGAGDLPMPLLPTKEATASFKVLCSAAMELNQRTRFWYLFDFLRLSHLAQYLFQVPNLVKHL